MSCKLGRTIFLVHLGCFADKHSYGLYELHLWCRASCSVNVSQALVEATPADVVLLYPHVPLACFALLALPSVTVFQRTVNVLAAVRWALHPDPCRKTHDCICDRDCNVFACPRVAT